MTTDTIPRLVQLATGPRVNCVRSGDPSREPVILIHGWPDAWFSYSRVMPLLPDALHAVAFDQRGFGDSDRPQSGYSIPEMAADVIALLDALALDRVTLVGHSFGSFVARQAAIAHPERVKTLVLIGTGFAASNQVTRDLQKSLRDLPDPIPVEFAREFAQSTVYTPVPSEFLERMVAASLKLPSPPVAAHPRSPRRVRRHVSTRPDPGTHPPVVGRSRRAVLTDGTRPVHRRDAVGAVEGLPGDRPLPELGAAGVGGAGYRPIRNESLLAALRAGLRSLSQLERDLPFIDVGSLHYFLTNPHSCRQSTILWLSIVDRFS